MERFIRKEELPDSLWCKDRGIIKLPNQQKQKISNLPPHLENRIKQRAEAQE